VRDSQDPDCLHRIRKHTKGRQLNVKIIGNGKSGKITKKMKQRYLEIAIGKDLTHKKWPIYY
jgi:hypothetical protein